VKRMTSVIGGLVLAAGSLLATSPSASAAIQGAYGCAGSEIDTYSVKNSSGVTYGVIHLYYDSATGRNCAANVATTAGGYGTASYKGVWIYKCKASVGPGGSCTTAYDAYDQDPAHSSTLYSQYAGPVSVSSAGVCIAVGGAIWAPNGTKASMTTYATHCG